ncbi:MAG: NAD(P)-binding domain-containing protein [Kocuria sp.]|uniref:shikimate dehydrogenase family protein n=2 Tax=Micrococcaceae TaxID=1268 RepID=UPI000F87535B|nr:MULTISPECIES: NAD(P)-binding domain-containing protein [Kocuria]MDO4256378.1 NAD(P)-binding domain-containing protein [Kocuria sp.]RUP81405.1 shikimate dehydrogenase [Kocuria sp. HSID17590]
MTATLHAAVLGHPVDHSLSPALHSAAFEVLGLDADYVRHDVPEQQWDEFWAGARASGHWRGFSVTMPLKPFAARDAERVTPLTRALGVANTLTFAQDGSVAADNTDVMGIMAALGAAGEIPASPRAVVLGGGATASAAVAALHGLGADCVDVAVRTAQRAESLTAVAEALGTSIRVLPWEQAGAALHGADVVVATLPPRGADELARGWREEHPRVSGVLLDVAYDPWPSALAAAWQDAGGAIAPGVDMLIFQAVDQLRWFTQGDSSRALPRENEVTAAMCRAVERPERVVPARVRQAQTTRLPR